MKIFYVLYLVLISQTGICQLTPISGPIGFGYGGGNKIDYRIEGSVFSALNITLSALNVANLNKANKSNVGFSIVTGFAQVGYGIIYENNIPATSRNFFKALNISVGTCTIFIGCFRLLKKSNSKSNLTWDMQITPVKNKNFGISFLITKRI